MTSDGGRRAGLLPVVGLAEHQSRVVLTSQLISAGVTYKAIRAMRNQGWIVEVLPGAWIVGTAQPTAWQRTVATCLMAGPAAVVSHATAGRVHNLARLGWDFGDGVELIVPPGGLVRLPGATLHRMHPLPPSEVTERRGLAVTTQARTMVDLAPRIPPDLLAGVVDEGVVHRLWEVSDLDAVLARVSRRPGLETLRQVIRDRAGSPSVDSVLEQRVIEALDALQPFEVHYQVVVAGRVFILDLAWPAVKVAVECDGWAVRSRSRSKFDHDRRRDNLLAAHGWAVVHVTSAMSGEEMLAAVVQILMQRAAGI